MKKIKRFLLSVAVLLGCPVCANATTATPDDTLFIAPFTTSPAIAAEDGKTFSIEMTNKDSIWGLQFDIKLPEGMHFAEGKNPFAMNSLRFPQEDADGVMTFRHTFLYNTLQDGWTRVLVYSMDPDLYIKGEMGELLKASYTTDSTMVEDTCAISLRNVYLVINGAKDVKPEAADTEVNVSSYSLGDANKDGMVDIADVVLVVKHFIENTTAGLDFSVADVNKDGSIDIADVVVIVNIYINNQ